MRVVTLTPEPACDDAVVGDRSALAWSTWPQAVRLLAAGKTRRPALLVSLVVGTLLTVVHQGEVLLAGDVGGATLARVAFNYALPYVVSSIGVLSACRTRSSARP